METNTKILLVDDEPEFTADMHGRLLAKGWQVFTVGNRLQAQEVARREKPDLVILGTILPRGDALQLHQWLKQSPDFRQVLSLWLMPRQKSVCLRAGAWTRA